MNQALNVSVKDAEPADSVSIRRLALDAKIDAWSEADYLDEISRPDSFVLKAMYHNDLTGFLVARIVAGKGEAPDAEIYNVAVAQLHKRRGIGTRLLRVLLDRFEEMGVSEIWLEVRKSNSDAISFYERHGFTAEMTRPNFYSNPTENGVVMRLQITPSPDASDGSTMLDSSVEEE